MNPLPVVSVIVPVLNEERVIGACLRALERQTCAAEFFEVIAADNGSTDRTVEILKSFGPRLNLKILAKPACSISALRNAAAKAAEGEFLAFLDADCVAPEDWIERGAALLTSCRRTIVGAHYTIPENSSWVARAWYGDMHWRKRGHVSYVPAGDMMISREAFLAVGGFDEGLVTSEDCDLCRRAGGAGIDIFADPPLSVVHLGTPQTVKAFYLKQRWHGTNVHSLFWRNAGHASGRKSALFTFYMLAALFATALSFPAAALFRSWAPVSAPLLLAAGPLWLAAGSALGRRSPAIWLPLATLYLIYGVARAMCVLVSRPARPEKHLCPPPALPGPVA
jgi:cellulose synthase/poly-beta-1,6-N-acetylglucosamine synthase-like glycosyltransferase